MIERGDRKTLPYRESQLINVEVIELEKSPSEIGMDSGRIINEC